MVGSRGQYSYFENSSCFAMIGGLSLMIFVFAAIVMLQCDDEKRSCPALPAKARRPKTIPALKAACENAAPSLDSSLNMDPAAHPFPFVCIQGFIAQVLLARSAVR